MILDISLRSDILEVTKIVKKTKAEMFKDLKVGSKIQLSVLAESVGGNRGTYASYITIKNLETGDYSHKSFNQIGSVLDKFEFKTV